MISNHSNFTILLILVLQRIITMAARTVRNELETPLILLRADNIPADVTLEFLLRGMLPHSSHIIGISRTADYHSKRLGSTVYFHCLSPHEASQLEEKIYNFGDTNPSARLTVADSILVRTVLPKESFLEDLDKKPASIHLTGLKEQKSAQNKTQYLIDLISYLERNRIITSIHLNYNVSNNSTRNDGYLMCLSKVDAYDLAGEVVPKLHRVNRKKPVKAALSFNILTVTRVNNAHMLTNGKVDWSMEAELINQLMIRIDPERALAVLPSIPRETVENQVAISVQVQRAQSQVECEHIPSSSSQAREPKLIANKSTFAKPKVKLSSVIVNPANQEVSKPAAAKRPNPECVSVSDRIMQDELLIPRISESQLAKPLVKRICSGRGHELKVTISYDNSEDDRLVIDEAVPFTDEEE